MAIYLIVSKLQQERKIKSLDISWMSINLTNIESVAFPNVKLKFEE